MGLREGSPNHTARNSLLGLDTIHVSNTLSAVESCVGLVVDSLELDQGCVLVLVTATTVNGLASKQTNKQNKTKQNKTKHKKCI